jgi:hypothetical protein
VRTLISLVVAGWFASHPAALAAASDSQVDRASLTGLTAMSVVVEDVGSLADRLGLTTATLERDVNQRLRKAGIVITPDADAYLYVHVTVGDPGAALPLPYVVEVSLMQEVTLPRGVKTRTPLQCPTWSVSRLGLTTSDRLRALANDRVTEFVEQFVAAYRSVNPGP